MITFHLLVTFLDHLGTEIHHISSLRMTTAATSMTFFLDRFQDTSLQKVLIHSDRRLSIGFQGEWGIAFQDIQVIMFCVAETVILLIRDFICLTDR